MSSIIYIGICELRSSTRITFALRLRSSWNIELFEIRRDVSIEGAICLSRNSVYVHRSKIYPTNITRDFKTTFAVLPIKPSLAIHPRISLAIIRESVWKFCGGITVKNKYELVKFTNISDYIPNVRDDLKTSANRIKHPILYVGTYIWNFVFAKWMSLKLGGGR